LRVSIILTASSRQDFESEQRAYGWADQKWQAPSMSNPQVERSNHPDGFKPSKYRERAAGLWWGGPKMAGTEHVQSTS
jgi:hypothetical protein